MSLLAQPLLQGLSHFDAAAHHHHVDVVGRSFEKKVANIATHYIAFQLQGISHSGQVMKDRLIKEMSQVGIGEITHVETIKLLKWLQSY